MPIRVAWVFAVGGSSYTMPINPDNDSDDNGDDPVYTETVPLGASQSSFQFSGRKSARRKITGIAKGSWVSTFRSNITTWRNARSTVSITDETGYSANYKILSAQWTPEKDNTEFRLYRRRVYRYTIELVRV